MERGRWYHADADKRHGAGLFSRRVPRIRRPSLVLGVLLFAALFPRPAHAEEACLDPASELGAAGARKGVQKRDFLKRLRVEASVWG